MRPTRLVIVVLLVIGWANVTVAQTEFDKLIAESDPAIQAQINATYHAQSDVDAYREAQTLKEATDDKGELVKQLAIFAATTESEEEFHVLLTLRILHLLELAPSIPIRVLAPYLDSDSQQLRDFAREWFQGYDSAAGEDPLNAYKSYVQQRLARNEKVPVAFVEYMYERSPGRALLTFQSGNVDLSAQLQAIHEALQAARQGRERSPDEIRQQREKKRQEEVRRHQAKIEQGEILLAEHIISNAIWLKENKFDERFQKVLPEAAEELAKLTKHKE